MASAGRENTQDLVDGHEHGEDTAENATGSNDPVCDGTPREVARAVANALDFLEQESAKLGVPAACELIQRASVLMRSFAERSGDGHMDVRTEETSDG